MYTGRGKSQLTEYASHRPILLVIYFTISVAYYFNLPVKGTTQRNHFHYLYTFGRVSKLFWQILFIIYKMFWGYFN